MPSAARTPRRWMSVGARRLIAASLVAVAICAVTPALAQAAGGSISGEVTSSESSERLAEVEVVIYNSLGGYVTATETSANGSYEVSGLLEADYKVKFVPGSGNYLTQYYNDKTSLAEASTVAVTAGHTTTGIDAKLQAGGEIEGEVQGAMDEPLPEAEVKVYNTEHELVGEANTTLAGTYSVPSLPSGSYVVQFLPPSGDRLDAAQYYHEAYVFSDAEKVSVNDGQIKTGIDATLALSAFIEGEVTDASTLAQLENVEVQAYDTSEPDTFVAPVLTDSSGIYVIEGLAPGTYAVKFSGPGNYSVQYYDDEPTLGSATPITLGAGGEARETNAALTAGGRISGSVKNTSEEPLGEVEVTVFNESGEPVQSVLTEPDGTYTVMGLATGKYAVKFLPGAGDYGVQYYQGKSTLAEASKVQVTSGDITSEINAVLVAEGSISGTVTEAAAPHDDLEGVEVLVFDSAEELIASAKTAADGTYTVPGLAPGAYVVEFSSASGEYVSQYYQGKAGFSEADPVTVASGDATTNIDAALDADQGSISGTVTSAASGNPVAGVAVRVYQAGAGHIASATTASNGTYTVHGLAPGSYELEFVPSSDAYLTQYYGGAASLDASTAVAVTAGATTSPIDASLKAPGAISGTVTSASTNAAVDDVEVEVFDSHGEFVNFAHSDTHGNYTVPGLMTGSYVVEFVPGGGYEGQFYSGASSLSEATKVSVTAGATTTAINAALAGAGKISGTVTSAATHDDLEGIEVQVYAPGGELAGSAHTASNGTYTVAGLGSGGYVVEFVSPSGTYARQFFEGAYSAAEATGVSVTGGSTTPGVDAALTASGAISGTVKSAGTHQALDEVQVEVYDASGQPIATTTTAANGTYTVTGLAPGSYEVEFAPTTGNYLPQFYDGAFTLGEAAEVPVAAGATTPSIDGELSVGAEISGTVHLPGGSVAAPEVEVSVYHAGTERPGTEHAATERESTEPIANTTTAANGTYTVGGLPSGSYHVRFEPLESKYPAGEYAPQYYNGAATPAHATKVSATAGSDTSGINATLATPGAISGKVTEATEPHSDLAGVVAKVYTLENEYVTSAETAANGTYTVGDLAAGEYEVEFVPSASYLPQYYKEVPLLSEATEVTVASGATTPNINAALIKPGAISGKVTKATGGAALEDVEVDVLSSSGSHVASAQTAANGTYTVSGLAPGNYDVEFLATTGNFAPQYYNDKPLLSDATAVSVTAGATHTGVNAALAEGGKITGTVTDANTHAALAGVQVSVYETERQLVATTATSGAGTYAVSGLGTASYEVQFVEPSGDYASQFFNGKASLAEASPVEVTAGSTKGSVNAKLVPAHGALSGQVTAASSHAPIGHVEVKVYDADGTYLGAVETTENGDYGFHGLPPGAYKIRFIPTTGDYLSQYYNSEASVAEASTVEVTAGSTTEGVSAELVLGGQISGTVTDAGTHAPLADVSVDVYSPSNAEVASAETGPNGQYTVSGLVPGTYEVRFDDGGGYAPQFYTGAASLAEARTVTVTAGATTADIDGALQTGGGIAGTVTNAVTHLPMPEVEVDVYDAGGSVVESETTAADGTYTVSSLPPGNYAVQFVPPSEVFVGQYYSGATSLAEAAKVAVTSGATAAGIDAAIAPAAAPSDVKPPSVTGTGALGSTLTCTPGEWSGAPAPTFTYQWLRDGIALAGATSSTYTVAAADQGHGLACAVTASNRVGHAQANSAALGIAAASSGTSAPQVSLAGAIGGTAGAVLVPLRCPAGTTACAPAVIRVTIVETVRGGKVVALAAKRSHKPTKRTVVVALQTVTLGAGKTETFKVTLNSSAKKLLLTHKKLAVGVQVSSEGKTIATHVVSVTRAKAKPKAKRKRS